MSAGDWLGLALLCLAGAASPGPSLFLVLQHSARSRGAGLRCALAHGLGVGLMAALAVGGLGALLQAGALRWLSLAGGAWLLWLSWRAWRAPPARADGSAPVGRPWRDGLLMAVANPKVLLFFAAIFTRFLPAEPRLVEQVGMAGLAALVDALWYALAALIWHQAGSLRARLHWLDKLGALVFAGVGLSLVYSGFGG